MAVCIITTTTTAFVLFWNWSNKITASTSNQLLIYFPVYADLNRKNSGNYRLNTNPVPRWHCFLVFVLLWNCLFCDFKISFFNFLCCYFPHPHQGLSPPVSPTSPPLTQVHPPANHAPTSHRWPEKHLLLPARRSRYVSSTAAFFPVELLCLSAEVHQGDSYFNTRSGELLF